MQTGSISLATWAGHDYNYMQFRTSSGGVEVGSVRIDSQGDVSVTGYWPYGSVGQTAFNVGSFPGSSFQPDPSGTFLKTYDDIFGTANGVFAVDTPNGAILGFKKPLRRTSAQPTRETIRRFTTRKPAPTLAWAMSKPEHHSWAGQRLSSVQAARPPFRMAAALSSSLQPFSLSPTFHTFMIPANCRISAMAFSPFG